MKTELRENLSYKKIISLLCLGIAIVGAFAVIFGDILIPVLSALLATLFTLEKKEKKLLSFIFLTFIILSNIAALLVVEGFASFFGFFSVALALIIHLFFTKGIGKTDCVVATTCVGVAFIVLSFVYFSMRFTGNYTLSAIPEFVSLLRVAFDRLMNESLTAMLASVPNSEEQLSNMLSQIGTIFDSIKMVSFSFAVILGFAVSGVALKIYTFLIFKMSDVGLAVFDWKFKTSRIFAYFYLVLSIVSVFTLSSNSLVHVAVVNLYNIFMVVYAYFGFNLALYLISARRSKVFAFLILVIAVLAFSSLAIEILSLMGVFYIITADRRGREKM